MRASIRPGKIEKYFRDEERSVLESSTRRRADYGNLALVVLSLSLVSFLARPVHSTTSSTGVVVPLYTYPTDGTWTNVIQVHNADPSVSIVAIINPRGAIGT